MQKSSVSLRGKIAIGLLSITRERGIVIRLVDQGVGRERKVACSHRFGQEVLAATLPILPG